MSTFLVERMDTDVTHTVSDHVVDSEGELLIEVSHSSLNYKDAMALAGDKGVMRVSPLVPGIDAVGRVVEAARGFAVGDVVTCNGAGLGEFRHGGFTSRLRVPAEATVKLPEGMTPWQAAALGTAGYTAALCVNALRDHGVKDGGRVLVTGATGGVGSIAVRLLSSLGFEVVAVTGRVDEFTDYLTGLGAAEVADRADLMEPGRPLQKAELDGVVDTLGGVPLANALARVTWGGVVAATGLASSPKLETTVLPFILRGVVLAGVNSVDAPKAQRERAWELLANHVDAATLESMTETVSFDEAAKKAKSLLAGHGHGRTVVEIPGT